MTRATFAAFLAAVFLSGCGSLTDSDPSGAESSATDNDPIEERINTACGEQGIEQVAMATRKAGYGSRTDYWLVLCRDDRRVRRVEIR